MLLVVVFIVVMKRHGSMKKLKEKLGGVSINYQRTSCFTYNRGTGVNRGKWQQIIGEDRKVGEGVMLSIMTSKQKFILFQNILNK
jgi:hypothetical protein